MRRRAIQLSYLLSTVCIITIIMLLLAGLVPATTNAWAPSRTDGTNESVEDKDKDGDGGDGGGDGDIPLDRSYDVNVLVIKYFPLTEEGTIDVDVTGDAAVFEGVTYEEIKQRTEDITNNWVFFIGEASSYLGYTDSSAEPALNYHIDDTIEHLEAVPIDPDAPVPLYPDYEGIMSDHNICDRVDNQGIDEVLIWAYEGLPQKLAISESKMAGPFGDMSNALGLTICLFAVAAM